MMIKPAQFEDAEALAEMRLQAMRPSLEAIGRFDPHRAKQRFLANFDPAQTRKVIIDFELAAFFVVIDNEDHLYLDHLYVSPNHQSSGIGTKLLGVVKAQAREQGKPIRLGALIGSRSNQFYQFHGFIKTHETEFDIYYEYNHSE